MALTIQRTWMVLLFVYFMVAFFQLRKTRITVHGMLHQHTRIIVLLSLLLVTKLMVTLHYGEARHLLYFVDDALFSAFVFTLFYCYISNYKELCKVLFMMVFGLFLTALLVPYEIIRGLPILSGMIDTHVQGSEVALSTKSREGAHRVQAFFDHPLLLTEFVVLTLPFALYLRWELSGWRRKVATLSVIASPFVILSTGSRSGILVGIAGTAVYVAALFWRKLRLRTKIVVSIFLLLTMGATLMQAASFIVEQGTLRETANMLEYEENERSTMERASQYLIVFGQVFDGQYFGYGVKQDYEKELSFLSHIDNYLLRVMLEGGIPAVLLFFLVFYSFSGRASYLLNHGKSTSDTRLASAMISFLASFILMKMFISMPTNNIYLYLVFGAFLGGRWQIKPSSISASKEVETKLRAPARLV